MKQKIKDNPRILGALEGLFGTGMIVSTALVPEAKDLAIPLYAAGGLAIVDGMADLISGRTFYLIERLDNFVSALEKKHEKRKLETIAKPCELREYCGDFHPIGKKACEGLKNYNECPLLTAQKDNRYPNRFSPLIE
jgi:hypothetical protein